MPEDKKNKQPVTKTAGKGGQAAGRQAKSGQTKSGTPKAGRGKSGKSAAAAAKGGRAAAGGKNAAKTAGKKAGRKAAATPKSRRGLVIALIIFVLIAAVIGNFVSGIWYHVDDRKITGANADWMAKIGDGQKLSSFTIPGTHDSGTCFIFPAYFLQDQNNDISRQLMMGYRYLDIRVKLSKDGNGLELCHSFGRCRTGQMAGTDTLTFDDVVRDTQAFLAEHPAETVIFCIKAEKDTDSVSRIQKLVMSAVGREREKWYTGSRIPALGEVRGKIVLARRFENVLGIDEAEAGLFFDWEDQGSAEVLADAAAAVPLDGDGELIVQDRYHYNTEDKWKAVTDLMNSGRAGEDALVLNFFSASYGKLPHPLSYAKKMNARFLAACGDLPADNYGILIFDFASEDLASAVIGLN
ncbi:MAG: phosphatidylinositol-specific phospholipase C domain-containing protein [Lachnospiraceae bacterium]|nr:phosphatidylinositol-specific phospholipase C domain-containing protein [Lachnospiraceae bacterium]